MAAPDFKNDNFLYFQPFAETWFLQILEVVNNSVLDIGQFFSLGSYILSFDEVTSLFFRVTQPPMSSMVIILLIEEPTTLMMSLMDAP